MHFIPYHELRNNINDWLIHTNVFYSLSLSFFFFFVFRAQHIYRNNVSTWCVLYGSPCLFVEQYSLLAGFPVALLQTLTQFSIQLLLITLCVCVFFVYVCRWSAVFFLSFLLSNFWASYAYFDVVKLNCNLFYFALRTNLRWYKKHREREREWELTIQTNWSQWLTFFSVIFFRCNKLLIKKRHFSSFFGLKSILNWQNYLSLPICRNLA